MNLQIEKLKESVIEYINQQAQTYIDTSHAIHDHPEIGNEEKFASYLLCKLLEEADFAVERGVAGHDTAFLAKKASARKGPRIGFLAEYDALPGLGHACGHNIIGTTSVGAAIALSQVLDEIGGELVVLGTPAEEGGPNGSAKGSFVKAGLVQDLNACMMVHPGKETCITGTTLAVDPIDFEFYGQASHAASAPEEDINALDAVIQLFNGVNALRQHVKDDVKIHGIITDGGTAPNIVPDYAKARFYIRAQTRKECDQVTERVQQIAKGAAMATGAKLNAYFIQNKVDHIQLNRAFDRVFEEVFTELGEDVDTAHKPGIGSSDAGNVSQVVPTIHPYIKIGAETLAWHTDEFREAAKSPEGDKGLLQGTKGLALIGLRLLTEEDTLCAIKDEFTKKQAELD